MATGSAAPTGAPLGSASYAEARFETQKIYQSGLLDAPDIWLWDFAFRGLTKDLTLSLEGVDTTSPLPARVRLYLQGGSDSAQVGEHHFTASWNGVLLDDISFEGKRPYLLEGTGPGREPERGRQHPHPLQRRGHRGVLPRLPRPGRGRLSPGLRPARRTLQRGLDRGRARPWSFRRRRRRQRSSST